MVKKGSYIAVKGVGPTLDRVTGAPEASHVIANDAKPLGQLIHLIIPVPKISGISMNQDDGCPCSYYFIVELTEGYGCHASRARQV
jgi:hypothetical protein